MKSIFRRIVGYYKTKQRNKEIQKMLLAFDKVMGVF